MKIPRRLQIFDGAPVVIPDKDVQRLSPHLCGPNHLQEMLMLGVNEEDLKRLVIIELGNKRRLGILSRLLSRYQSVQRRKLWKRLLDA